MNRSIVIFTKSRKLLSQSKAAASTSRKFATSATSLTAKMPPGLQSFYRRSFYRRIHSKDILSFQWMEFLQNEDFLRFRSSAGDGDIFLGVQLTLKGLAVLDKTPASIKDGKSIAQKIKSVIAMVRRKHTKRRRSSLSPRL